MGLGVVIVTAVAVSGVLVQAKQPGAPEPDAAPLRELKYGQINFLHTTDTHGWHAGHLNEPSYSADWGDYIDFAGRMRERVEADGKDLLLVDTGDRIEGNGLYDASEPKGKYTFDIFKQQHIDIICSGNHELYKQNSSENEFNVTVPAYKDNYLASNLDIHDPTSGEVVPLAQRYKKFTTAKQGLRIMAFGFLYDFQGNSKNTIVQPVEEVIKKDWFQKVIRDRDVDLFVVIGHAAVRSAEFDAIFKAIRGVQWDVPIQFFGGHVHIRDYKKYDPRSYGLASGRFMETIGFQSIDGIATHSKDIMASSGLTFFRRYIDNNLYSFYHHSGHNESSFHSDQGRKVSRMIDDSRAALELNTTFGCAPRDLWMSRAQYPSKDSIFTWLEQQVIPNMVNDTSRMDVPRLVFTNTGAIRFDIFEGPFTKDSTYIICPFTSGFHYIRNVPYGKASKLIEILNNAGDFLTQADGLLDTTRLAPPEQWEGRLSFDRAELDPAVSSSDQQILSSGLSLRPGYTTKDDDGDDGDDTIHSPIKFYRVPNCIQSLVNTTTLESGDTEIDLVFNEFIQPWVLLALRFLGLEYSDKDVAPYMHGENFTNMIARWITDNWSDNC